jgi:hypothetical protein
MASARQELISRVASERPFEVERPALESLWLAAANDLLAERREQIPVLRRVADAAGIEKVSSLEDLVPLLFAHSVYKSYPRSLLEKRRWDGLTNWLDTVAATSVKDVDLNGVETQDDWVAALARSGHPLYASSGTSGKSSFLPATPGDRAFTMNCIVRAVQWQHQIKPDRSNAVVVLAPSRGSSRALEYYRHFSEAYGDPHRTYFLTDEPALLSDLTRMASLTKSIADGTAMPSELTAFEADMADRRRRIDGDWDRLADVVIGMSGERVIIQGFWAQQWTLVERLRSRGIAQLPLRADSLLGVGGGTKGANLPPDFEAQVFDFYGLSDTRQASGYSMSELSAGMPQIGDRYVVQPWIIPLLLSEDGTELINPSGGQHEGRFAFFDTAIEGRWGGLISGDRVIADFDTPNVTIVAGSVARYSDLLGGEDDRLTCAGTVDAFVRGLTGDGA